MAQANCSLCSTMEDTRSLLLCPRCGQWVCQSCVGESGVCQSCEAEDESQ